MSESVVPLPVRPRSEMAGYVEAMTENAALGWTWRPGSAERLTVELRLGSRVVARGRAEEMRDDLAQSGIGDGRHAFTLPIPEEFRPSLSELRVVAAGEDGAEIALNAPPVTGPPQAASNASLANLQRGIEALIGSQRVMHRNLQAALLQQPSVSNALAEITTAQAGLRETLDTFELIAVRLEQALAHREAPPRAVSMSRAVMAVGVVAILSLIGSSYALWRSVTG